MQAELPVKRECRYSLRQCHKAALDGYQFCRTHILEDTNNTFQQCSYVSTKTGRRCVQATMKPQKKDGLCPQHSSKVNRTRCALAKKQMDAKTDSAEGLLGSLEHYSNTLYNNSQRALTSQQNDSATSFLAELASSSDSEVEERTSNTASMWMPDSDSESIDSENEDIFKYAEVLTAEEATRITRDKLIRLQSLYIEQFKWLQHCLKEGRRKYLKRKVQENPGTSAADDRSEKDSDAEDSEETDTEEPRLPPVKVDSTTYDQYVASRRYHKRHGEEALMYIRSQERRRAVCDAPATELGGAAHYRYRHASRHGTKYCSLKSVKCHERSLPFTRFCLHHVEFDTHQMLYRRCGYQAVPSGLSCERIVANFNEHNRCDYHTNVSDLQAMSTDCAEEAEESVNEVEVVDEGACSLSVEEISQKDSSENPPADLRASSAQSDSRPQSNSTCRDRPLSSCSKGRHISGSSAQERPGSGCSSQGVDTVQTTLNGTGHQSEEAMDAQEDGTSVEMEN